jgi:hypothetical protein
VTLRIAILALALGATVWWFRARWQAVAAAWRGNDRRLPRVPSALRGGRAGWVLFVAPNSEACLTARQLIDRHLQVDNVVVVDATTDPELAARWSVERVPTALEVDATGVVANRLVGVDAVRRHLDGMPDDSEPLGGTP